MFPLFYGHYHKTETKETLINDQRIYHLINDHHLSKETLINDVSSMMSQGAPFSKGLTVVVLRVCCRLK